MQVKTHTFTDVLIIGAGASGCFTAIRLAEYANILNKKLEIHVLERQSKPLQKVKISGGGRCNVTHASNDVPFLLEHYPRKHSALKQQLHQFKPSHMQDWLLKHGVPTHSEADGRVFPTSNNSQSVIKAFLQAFQKNNIHLHLNERVLHVEQKTTVSGTDFNCYEVQSISGKMFYAKKIVLATGSHPSGYDLAESLNLMITPLSPSLFTFSVKNQGIHAMAGLSIQEATLLLKIPLPSLESLSSKTHIKYSQSGPVLFTHWGLSGPATLKLSAKSACELKASGYQATAFLNALPQQTQDQTLKKLVYLQIKMGKRQLKNANPFNEIPQRYWEFLLKETNISQEKIIAELTKKELNKLVEALHHFPIEINGKGQFKEEFVTAGGVSVDSLNIKYLEAKNSPECYVVGELLNVDAMTGGFNFQHCWASAEWVAKSIMNRT